MTDALQDELGELDFAKSGGNAATVNLSISHISY
jgi:hypothetical protein